MKPLNHNHLYYFWLAARHRNVTAAARQLGLAQPTVSAQIRALEAQLKTALLVRRGRSIDLTEAGQVVYRHAEEMFRISAEIPDAIAGRFTGGPRTLFVGTSDFVPKPIVRRVFEPVLREEPDVRLVCREWRIDELFAELALFQLDVVLADRPHPDGSRVRAMSSPVIESALAIYAKPALARRLRRGFPRSLHGEPMFMPSRNTALRESLDRWMLANRIEPVILGEFEDRALLKAFGGGGLGAFPAAATIEDEVRAQYGVERVGWVRGVRETYYLIAVERRAAHPVVDRLMAEAAARLRASDGGRSDSRRLEKSASAR